MLQSGSPSTGSPAANRVRPGAVGCPRAVRQTCSLTGTTHTADGVEIQAVRPETWREWSDAGRWELVELYRDVLEEDAAAFNQTPDERGHESQGLFDHWITTGEVTYWTVREESRIVCALRLHHPPEGLLIEALHTLPARRGQGIAQTLVREVARAHEDEVLRAEVLLDNRAPPQVMRACGFVETASTGQVSMWVRNHTPKDQRQTSPVTHRRLREMTE